MLLIRYYLLTLWPRAHTGRYTAGAVRITAGAIVARDIHTVVLPSQKMADQGLKQFMRIILGG